jgi:SAM-dependent methyltransferase
MMELPQGGAAMREQRGASDPEEYFRTRFLPTPARDRVWRAICRYLERFIPPDAAVLDLGAGYCSFINHVRAADKHALDVYPGFVHYAGPDVATHVGPCWALESFVSERFDAVFASNLLEHLTRRQVRATLREVRRVLKPAGRLLIVQPNFRYCARQYFDDYTHRLVFTHVSLADLVAAEGFRVERVEPRFLPLTFKSRWPAHPWLVALYLRSRYRPFGKQMLVIASRPPAP